jgi:hypothetical protein
MVSTVTTTTVTTVTTIALAASLGMLAICTLLIILMQKEVISSLSGSRAKSLSKILNVSIVPLAIAAAMIIVMKVVEILQ